jgi:hypothetical protein
MKYITFSLWGAIPMYTIGMIKNAELSKTIYPGWKLCVYYKNIPQEILSKLHTFEHVLLIDASTSILPGQFWRFVPPVDYEYMIVRDTDSRLSLRESTAVTEWIQSGKTLHIMRDHPHHGAEILAGMWGIKRDNSFNLKNECDQFVATQRGAGQFNRDQIFLKTCVYPNYKDNQLAHDSCHTSFSHSKPFPTPMVGMCFVGEKWYENDTPFWQRKFWVDRKELR